MFQSMFSSSSPLQFVPVTPPSLFPTTSILDNFNRGDLSDIAGSLSWISALFGQPGIGIVSNQASIVAGTCNNVWNVSYTDAEAYVTLVDAIYGTNDAAVGVRFSGSGSTPSGYFLYWNNGSGVQSLGFYRFDSGSSTQLGSNIPVTLAAGDKIGLSMIGTNLTAYIYQSGAWSSVGTQTDATYGSGLLWLYGSNNLSTTWIADDFGGGEVV